MRPKNLKECMKLNWNFQRWGGVRKTPFHWGGTVYGYFLELHNTLSQIIKLDLIFCFR